jgi:SAM-dependent methyltransferase
LITRRILNAREENQKVHDRLYEECELFKDESWLKAPCNFVLKSFDLIQTEGPHQILDLGCGVGRHAIPAAKKFPDCEIDCVDILDSALIRLKQNAISHGVEKNIRQVKQYLDYYQPLLPISLVIACSSLEHCQSFDTMKTFIAKLIDDTKKGGIHCFMIGCDISCTNVSNNEQYDPLTTFDLSSSQCMDFLKESYNNHEILHLDTKPWISKQYRDNYEVLYKSECVQFLARL